MTPLSPHFTLEELTRSQMAARAGEDLSHPPPEVLANLTALCLEVLEPVRELLGVPMYISSGWRPRWLNIAIGGAAASAHMDGDAADCEFQGLSPAEAATRIAASSLNFDKCILEFNRWVHLARAPAPAPQLRQVLTGYSRGGRTYYATGIILAGDLNV